MTKKTQVVFTLPHTKIYKQVEMKMKMKSKTTVEFKQKETNCRNTPSLTKNGEIFPKQHLEREKNMDGFNYNKIKDCVPSRNSKKKLDKEVKKLMEGTCTISNPTRLTSKIYQKKKKTLL